jgi:cysteine desulfurase
MYSSKGAGIFYLGKGAAIESVMTGGGQEFGFRSGTENIPAIVGLARGMELAVQKREKETKRIGLLKAYFLKELRRLDRTLRLNGSEKGLPHILNVSFSKISGADLLLYLDLHGVAVSAGSACAARSPEPSHVLLALGLKDSHLLNSLRFSFGRGTTKAHLMKTLRLIKDGLSKKQFPTSHTKRH